MEVTTARVRDKRRMLKKTKTYRLAIRVTHNRKPILFPIPGLALSKNDYEKLASPRLGPELCQVRDKFIEEEKRAIKIIKDLGTFTFQAFKEEFYKDSDFHKRKKARLTRKLSEDSELSKNNSVVVTSTPEGKNKHYGRRKYNRIRSLIDFEKLGPLAVAYGEYIKKLELQEKIGTSEAYFSSLLSLLDFRKGLRLEDITETFLYEYEQWMLKKECAYTSIGIYLRPLRAIINLIPNKKLFTEETYPFGKGKYIIPTGVGIKKALGLREIKLLYDYRPESEHADIKSELFAIAMWFFGFFAYGINPKDIAYLKYKYIDDDEEFIIINREKTKNTRRRQPKPLEIPITEDMKRIMIEWGNPDKSPDNYIFPILQPGLSAHRRYELVQGFLSNTNDWMRKITGKLGIKKTVRTMEYRHSMATILKRSGVNTTFIQEVLGHADPQTTEAYLDSFEKDVKKERSNFLSSFKDIKVA